MFLTFATPADLIARHIGEVMIDNNTPTGEPIFTAIFFTSAPLNLLSEFGKFADIVEARWRGGDRSGWVSNPGGNDFFPVLVTEGPRVVPDTVPAEWLAGGT